MRLKTWLTDSTARVIMIDRTWDFTSSEGTTSATGCAPWTCSNGYTPQKAINANGWCGSQTSASVSYYNAGTTPIDLGSNKSIVGVGTAGVIKGKGFRIRGGVSNIIIQNLHITVSFLDDVHWVNQSIDLLYRTSTRLWSGVVMRSRYSALRRSG